MQGAVKQSTEGRERDLSQPLHLVAKTYFLRVKFGMRFTSIVRVRLSAVRNAT